MLQSGEQPQRVVWALDYACDLRPSGAKASAAGVRERLAKIKAYSTALRAPSIQGTLVGDVMVTGFGRDRALRGELSPTIELYPETGFVVSQEFARWQGPTGLFDRCGRCPANLSVRGLAGCSGSLYRDPDSPRLEEALRTSWERIAPAHPDHRLETATTPIWYGLWAESPLPSESLGFYLSLFTSCRTDWEGDTRELDQFLAALQHARKEGWAVRVELLPPSRRELDIVTIFPHCPRCRASALDQRWQQPVPTALQTCSTCGTRFSPAEHTKRWRSSKQSRSLLSLLGEEAFFELNRTWLRGREVPPDACDRYAQVLVAAAREEERNRAAVEERAKLEAKLLDEWVFKGVEACSPPPDELEDSQRWFRPEAFEGVLRRAQANGLTVRYMSHWDTNPLLIRHLWESIDDSERVLRAWLAEGCRNRFCAIFVVPPEQLESLKHVLS